MEETTKLDRWVDSGGGDDCGARYHLRKAPELTPEMACLRWRELNLLLHSLALLHTDLEGKQPFLPVLRTSGTIVAARRGLLYLWDENGGGIRLKVGFGLGHRAPERLRATNRMAEAALQWRKPILVHDPPEEPLREELGLLGELSCLTAPILKHGLPWGAVQFARPEPFGEDEAVLLWMYCLILEGAVPGITESARLLESSSAPGLVGRRLFEWKLDREIEHSGWAGHSCSLLRVRWQTREGMEGPGEFGLRSDRTLRVIRRSLRPEDLIAPWEEGDLLISLPDRDGLEAERVAQTVRRNLIQSGALVSDGRPLSLLRLVIATSPVHGRRKEDLFRTLESLLAAPEKPLPDPALQSPGS